MVERQLDFSLTMKSMAQECQEWWQEYARLNPAAEVVVGLQEWRDTLAFSEDEMRALVLSDGIRVLERPRELMEKMKDTIVQLKQEDLLNTIRSSPMWASQSAGNVPLRSGNVWLQDGADDEQPDVNDMPGRVRELIRRSGVSGGSALRQRWKRRYLVLSEDWVEFYREVERRGAVGQGSKKLDRILKERVSSVYDVAVAEDLSHFTLFVRGHTCAWTLSAESPESVQAWVADFEKAKTQSRTGSVELRESLRVFSEQQGFGKDEIITRMDKIVGFAKDRGMLGSSASEVFGQFKADAAYDPMIEQQQRTEDELGQAFTVLRQAVDKFVEEEVLNPQAAAMRLIRQSVEASSAHKVAAVMERVTHYKDEPQPGDIFQIPQKFVSPSNWAPAVQVLQAFDGSDDWPLPSAAAEMVRKTVNAIYTTFQHEHPDSTAIMGADDLNPVLTYVIIRAGVRFLPLFVDMMQELCFLDGEIGYNVITITSMLTYIEHEMQLPEGAGALIEDFDELDDATDPGPLLTVEPVKAVEPVDTSLSVRVTAVDVDSKDVYIVSVCLGSEVVHEVKGRYSELKKFAGLPALLGDYCQAKYPPKDFISSNLEKKRDRHSNTSRRIDQFTDFFSDVLDVHGKYLDMIEEMRLQLMPVSVQSHHAGLQKVHDTLGMDLNTSGRCIEAGRRPTAEPEPEPEPDWFSDDDDDADDDDGQEQAANGGGLARTRSKVLRESMRDNVGLERPAPSGACSA